jgi:hypothetical protein
MEKNFKISVGGHVWYMTVTPAIWEEEVKGLWLKGGLSKSMRPY